MALVVLLRGINVGGHRTFRPTGLARELGHLGAVNIGAAGTFVIRQRVTRARLRAEVARRLPFEAEIMICEGREIVSLLSRAPRSAPSLPMNVPSRGRWLLKVLALDGRFVVGLYRRHMKVIRYLGTLDRVFGVSLTTRGWSTVAAVAKVLDSAE